MSPVATTPRVLVVDDDAPFRAFVRELLERVGHDVVDVPDARLAIDTAMHERPDLAIVDVLLPEISGYELLRELHDLVDPQLPVILVSGRRTAKEDVISGLLLGADDYLVKPFDPDELLVRVRRSLARRFPSNADIVSWPSEPLEELTSRELEVLTLLAAGLSQGEVASRLVVSPRTVGTHIQHILTKLDVHTRAQAVAFALRNGVAGDVQTTERVSWR
jgi:DNA-binding NarL/FixJ family response regulator